MRTRACMHVAAVAMYARRLQCTRAVCNVRAPFAMYARRLQCTRAVCNVRAPFAMYARAQSPGQNSRMSSVTDAELSAQAQLGRNR